MTNNTPDYEDNLYFPEQKCKGDLTEQWRKGELPEGRYWVNVKGYDEVTMLYYWSDIFLDGDVPVNNSKISEVLATVPSYDKWEQLKEYERIVKSYYGKPIDYDIACETVNKLLDEKKFLKEEISAYKRLTAQLKELLKECKDLFVLEKGFMVKCIREETLTEIITKIDEALR